VGRGVPARARGARSGPGRRRGRRGSGSLSHCYRGARPGRRRLLHLGRRGPGYPRVRLRDRGRPARAPRGRHPLRHRGRAACPVGEAARRRPCGRGPDLEARGCRRAEAGRHDEPPVRPGQTVAPSASGGRIPRRTELCGHPVHGELAQVRRLGGIPPPHGGPAARRGRRPSAGHAPRAHPEQRQDRVRAELESALGRIRGRQHGTRDDRDGERHACPV
jgi:hypothetical protein